MTASAKEVMAAALEPIAFEEWHPIGECNDCDRDRERCVSAILAALDAAGYVVVPREPTEAADVIDALVETLERAANEGQKGQLSLHTLMACGDALARARRK